ncbi:hypothetical protein FRC00_012619, partial [Tulasnella sp. 408]
MYDPHTRESRGFGFVTMDTAADAEAAIAALNGTDLKGRNITVDKARRGRARTPTPGRYYGPPKRADGMPLPRFLTSLKTLVRTILVLTIPATPNAVDTKIVTAGMMIVTALPVTTMTDAMMIDDTTTGGRTGEEVEEEVEEEEGGTTIGAMMI